MPDKLIFTLSEYSGSYLSRDFGVTSSGIENNFKFPFPDIFNVACKDSVAFNELLDVTKSKLNLPTAPEKLEGFPCSGNG